MDVGEESLGTTQHVPHPDRHQESSSPGWRAPTADAGEALRGGSWGVRTAVSGTERRNVGGVPGPCGAPGHPLFARDALSRVTGARQRVRDKAAGRGKPEPRRGPAPGESHEQCPPSARPTGVHLRPTQQARRRVPTRGPPTRGEGSAAAMTGGRARVRPAPRAGSAPSPAPSPGSPPVSVGSPDSGGRAAGARTHRRS